MKRFLEMRGADGGPWRRLCALPALWVGLLYDQTALDAAWDICRSWTAEERQGLRDAVPKGALKTRFRRYTVQDLAREVLAVAREGLEARARQDGMGHDESVFLDAVEDIVGTGRTPAEELLDRYYGPWNREIDPVFREYAY